ncbi:hypothetical protein HYX58_05930 [Candidatus Dependentiae bacterium]|nr:hypothetical protein [Candidatus Dependentiae bacterium]
MKDRGFALEMAWQNYYKMELSEVIRMFFKRSFTIVLIALLAISTQSPLAEAFPTQEASTLLEQLAEKTSFNIKISPIMAPYQVGVGIYNHPWVAFGSFLGLVLLRNYYQNKIHQIAGYADQQTFAAKGRKGLNKDCTDLIWPVNKLLCIYPAE